MAVLHANVSLDMVLAATPRPVEQGGAAAGDFALSLAQATDLHNQGPVMAATQAHGMPQWAAAPQSHAVTPLVTATKTDAATAPEQARYSSVPWPAEMAAAAAVGLAVPQGLGRVAGLAMRPARPDPAAEQETDRGPATMPDAALWAAAVPVPGVLVPVLEPADGCVPALQGAAGHMGRAVAAPASMAVPVGEAVPATHDPARFVPTQPPLPAACRVVPVQAGPHADADQASTVQAVPGGRPGIAGPADALPGTVPAVPGLGAVASDRTDAAPSQVVAVPPPMWAPLDRASLDRGPLDRAPMNRASGPLILPDMPHPVPISASLVVSGPVDPLPARRPVLSPASPALVPMRAGSPPMRTMDGGADIAVPSRVMGGTRDDPALSGPGTMPVRPQAGATGALHHASRSVLPQMGTGQDKPSMAVLPATPPAPPALERPLLDAAITTGARLPAVPPSPVDGARDEATPGSEPVNTPPAAPPPAPVENALAVLTNPWSSAWSSPWASHGVAPVSAARGADSTATAADIPAPVVAQVARTIMRLGGTAEHGPRHMALDLHPESLGAVQVRITPSDQAGARIEITVGRAETLALLQADTRALHHALDAAGFAVAGRELTLQLTPPDGASTAQAVAPFTPPSAGDDAGQRFTPRGDHPARQGEDRANEGRANGGADPGMSDVAPLALPRRRHGPGLDITA